MKIYVVRVTRWTYLSGKAGERFFRSVFQALQEQLQQIMYCLKKARVHQKDKINGVC